MHGSPPLRARILFLIDHLDENDLLGGTERQIRQLIAGLQEQGATMSLAVLHGRPWPRIEQVFNCPTYFAQAESLSSLHGMAALVRLRRWIRVQRFDALQTFFIESNLIGPFIARAARVPVVIGSRRNLNYWMGRRAALLQRLANTLVTRLIANAQAVKDVIVTTEGISPSKVCVLYNTLETGRFSTDAEARARTRRELSLPPDAIVVGTVSNLRPVKGLPELIDAAARVHRLHPEVRFVIIGEGPLRADLERQIAGLGLIGVVLLIGRKADVPAYLNAMDIAVSSSTSEGFSNSILEYMAAGLSVVATRVGGNEEAIHDAGILIPPGDSTALGSAILQLVDQPDSRMAMAEKARSRAGEFDIERSGSKIRQCYAEILKRD